MLCSPVIVSLVHQLVHLLWVDHGRRDTQRPGVGHCWCWQLLQAILYVFSILYYISSPVSFWTWMCVCLCIFQLDNSLKAKVLCWHWGPFTVNLTPLRGQDRAFFSFFFLRNLVAWHKSQSSSHSSTSKSVNLSKRNYFIQQMKMQSETTTRAISSQSKVLVGPEIEGRPGCLLLQTVVWSWGHDGVSVQFIYSCHFLSKLTNTFLQDGLERVEDNRCQCSHMTATSSFYLFLYLLLFPNFCLLLFGHTHTHKLLCGSQVCVRVRSQAKQKDFVRLT